MDAFSLGALSTEYKGVTSHQPTTVFVTEAKYLNCQERVY
jgi:hypothetical protein